MIEADGLTRRFGALTAVDAVSLRVPDGSLLALLGPNGAGKTTTVRLLAGLLAPSTGSARTAGFDVRTDPAAVRARVGLVTDVPGLYEQMTPPAYLEFFGRMYGLDAATRARRSDELLTLFELRERRKERMAGFSKGMKQKVALARALLHEPAALFLDEPTSGLDPLAARAVRELIVQLKHASRSIILCTHDLAEAERLADKVAIMRQGRIVVADSPAGLRAAASAATLVTIELAAPCPSAGAALAAIPDLTLDASTPGDGALRLTYRTARPREINPVAIARLVAVGAQVVAVACQTRSLEDVYVSALGSQGGESGGEAVAEVRPALTAEGAR